MSFVNAMSREMNTGASNISITENGAAGYRTSGKNLLDLNFRVASLRKAAPEDIADRFCKAFFDDKITAMKWLFYARDVRGGLGERRLFRVVIESMARDYPEYLIPLLDLIPVYGRYDDLWCLLDTDLSDKVLDIVISQLRSDIDGVKHKKPISLLAKWLPSANASSVTTKRYANLVRRRLGVSERDYRLTLSRLRSYLDVVERKMSAKQWGEIAYETVPSRANLIYNSAFLRNDELRRRDFLSKVEKGEKKINAGTLYPHDIVAKYTTSGWGRSVRPYDQTLEALWEALPDTVQGCGNTIVVADGSGSMTSRVGKDSNVSALDVANALAIYFAERSFGQFRDKYITFSEHPQLVDLSGGQSLREKLMIANKYDECANTNIEAVFDLILDTAVHNHMPHLFDEIARRYQEAGYQLPRLVFWNVNSRTGTIPVIENELGVALVSGFSVNIVNMVMSNKTDPYECLLDALNAERYAPIGEALKGL